MGKYQPSSICDTFSMEIHSSICHTFSMGIRERGSVLYLEMAKEMSKYHTDASAGKRPKKLLPPKLSMQTELYCLAVHKTLGNVPENTQYSRNKSLLHSQNNITFVVVAPFSPFDYILAGMALLASYDSELLARSHFDATRGHACQMRMRSSHANARCILLLVMVAFGHLLIS